MDDNATNATAEAVVARLPQKELINLREIADALDLVDARTVSFAVAAGALAAVKAGREYKVSREEAARWIRSLVM